MKAFYDELFIKSDQNNLIDLQTNLRDQLTDLDYFFIRDLTDKAVEWVEQSQIKDGLFTIQTHHTTCILALNELNEPCLLADIAHFLRESLPKNRPYLHHSALRTQNIPTPNFHDRNADAHMKSLFFGTPSQTIIIRDGKLVLGEWQTLCFIDFDGPHDGRKVTVQILGS